MAQLSTQRLNELLQQVIEERNLAGGWTTFSLPESLREVIANIPPYEPEVSVADVLEEGVGGLWDPQLARGWGSVSMRSTPHARCAPPTEADPQPTFGHTCYQCGRPVTTGNTFGVWRDHAGRSSCDHALVDNDYPDHYPEPWSVDRGPQEVDT